MSKVSHLFNQSCHLMTAVVNGYGESVPVSTKLVPCRLREITGLEKTGNREEYNCDAILWVNPDVAIKEGSVISCNNVGFRVNKIIVARGATSEIQFLKCLLDRYEVSLEDAS
jgi:hypothetical protein